MMGLTSKNPARVTALLYALYFLALFAQFPLKGRLPGNCDTWYAVAFTDIYLNRVREFLGLGTYGSFMYPVENPFSYGETSLALAIVPMTFRALGFSELPAYYLFLSLLYAGTAFGAYLVATLFVRHRGACALAGLFFATCNFLLSTIDSPHTAFFGVAFASLFFFKRYLERAARRDLLLAGLLAGLQVYFSAYVFLLLGVMMGALALTHCRLLLGRPGELRRLASAAALSLVLIVPFFVFYATRLMGHFSWQSQAVLFAEFNSIDPQDLWNPMPDNLIYPEGPRFMQTDARALQGRLAKSDPSFRTESFALLVGKRPADHEESLWVSSRRRAFVGLVPWALALMALFRGFRGRRDVVALLVAGFALALGPGVSLGGTFVPTPLYWMYEYLPGFHLFRIPGRAFALSVLGIAIAMAKGVEMLLESRAGGARWKRAAIVLGVAALVVVENVPFPMRSFEATRYLRPPEEYLKFFSGRKVGAILNLPSGIGYGLAGSADDLYVFNRELVYMNWQTYHGNDIANGVNGYIPLERIEVQKLIAALPRDEAIEGLRDIGVDFIVFNKEMLLEGERSILLDLRRSPELECLLDGSSTVVFGVRP